MLDRSEFFECICDSDEHTIRFVLDREENEIYLNVFLHQYRNIFKRIWIAIKYVFGYKCKFGHWDGWIMKNEDARRLINILEELKDEN